MAGPYDTLDGSSGGDDNSDDSRDYRALNIKLKNKGWKQLGYFIIFMYIALLVSLVTTLIAVVRLSLWLLEVHAENTRREDDQIGQGLECEVIDMLPVEESNSPNQMVAAEMEEIAPDSTSSTRANEPDTEDTETYPGEMACLSKNLYVVTNTQQDTVPKEDTGTSEMAKASNDLCLEATAQPDQVPKENTETLEMANASNDLFLGATAQPDQVPKENTETLEMANASNDLFWGATAQPDQVPKENTETLEMANASNDLFLGATAQPDQVPKENTERSFAEMAQASKVVSKVATSSKAPWSGKEVVKAPHRWNRPPDKYGEKEEELSAPKFTHEFCKNQEVRSYCEPLQEEATHDIISDMPLIEVQETGETTSQMSEDVPLTEYEECMLPGSSADQTSGANHLHATSDEQHHESMATFGRTIPLCKREMDKSKEKELNRGETSSNQNSLPTADIPTAVQDDSRSKKMTKTGEPVKVTEKSLRDEDGVSQNDEADLHMSNEDPPPDATGELCILKRTSTRSVADKGREGTKGESSDAQNSHQN